MVHPTNRFQRRLVKAKNEKKNEKERSGRVWRKLNTELYKAQEYEDELRHSQDRDASFDGKL